MEVVGTGVSFGLNKGAVVVCVIVPGGRVIVFEMEKTGACGVVVENTGSNVGTSGREGLNVDLFNKTNITATPISRSMMIIASAMISPT